MKFEEQFPSLAKCSPITWTYDNGMIEHLGGHYNSDVQKHCLDKQKVKESIMKRKLEWRHAEPVVAMLIAQTFDNLLKELRLEE